MLIQSEKCAACAMSGPSAHKKCRKMGQRKEEENSTKDRKINQKEWNKEMEDEESSSTLGLPSAKSAECLFDLIKLTDRQVHRQVWNGMFCN
jgi:hypothetical protein